MSCRFNSATRESRYANTSGKLCPVSTCITGNGIRAGANAFCANRNITIESLPPENNNTGRSNSATTSRITKTLSASRASKCDTRYGLVVWLMSQTFRVTATFTDRVGRGPNPNPTGREGGKLPGSVRSRRPHDSGKGPHEDDEVQGQGPVLHVPQVEPDRFLPRQVGPAGHLPEAGHARLDGQPAPDVVGVRGHLLRQRRAGADERHVALEHVEQL